MKATRLLKHQHDEVELLFRQYEHAIGAQQKRKLFAAITARLVAHPTIEAQLFHPAAFLDEVEEHIAAKRLMVDMLTMTVEHPQFDAMMRVLRREMKALFEQPLEPEIVARPAACSY